MCLLKGAFVGKKVFWRYKRWVIEKCICTRNRIYVGGVVCEVRSTEWLDFQLVTGISLQMFQENLLVGFVPWIFQTYSLVAGWSWKFSFIYEKIKFEDFNEFVQFSASFNPLNAKLNLTAICWHYKELTIFSMLAGWELKRNLLHREYTGCPRRNGQNFGRVFLMLNYTDITQNTYIQNWTVT